MDNTKYCFFFELDPGDYFWVDGVQYLRIADIKHEGKVIANSISMKNFCDGVFSDDELVEVRGH